MPKSDDVDVLTHSDTDVQDLINEYVSIMKRYPKSKRDYLISIRKFWRDNPPALPVEILICQWKQKIEDERVKAASRGVDLDSKQSQYNVELSNKYRTACLDYLEEKTSVDSMLDLLGKFETRLTPEHENLKRKMLANFMMLHPKYAATSDLEDASDAFLAYLKRSNHLSLKELLRASAKRRCGVEGEKLQQLIEESMELRCGGGGGRMQELVKQSVDLSCGVVVDRLLEAAASIGSAASDAISAEHSRVEPRQGVAGLNPDAGLRDGDSLMTPASNEDEVALNWEAVARGAPSACVGVHIPVAVEVVSPRHVTRDDRGSGQEVVAECFIADETLEFQQDEVQCVAGFQGVSCRDEMGEAKFCFLCESTAVIPCMGYQGSACVVQGAFCNEHCHQGVCNLCRPSFTTKNKKAGLKTCTSCGLYLYEGSKVIVNRYICNKCDAPFCNRCALRWETKMGSFICPTDATPAEFYKERHRAARAWATKVKIALETEVRTDSSSSHKKLQTLLDRFCLMFCMLNRHRQFEMLNELYCVLNMMLDYQASKRLPPSVTLLSERLYLPGGEEASDELALRIARMAKNAYGRQGPQQLFEHQYVKPRKRAYDELLSGLTARSRVPVGALICNLKPEPSRLQLMCNSLKLLLKESDFDLYILALDVQKSSIEDLVGSHRSDRCICFEPAEPDIEIASRINVLRLRVVLDIVGSHEGSKVLQHLDRETSIVNLAGNPVPCDGSTWDGCVVDRQMLKALACRTDAVKGLYLFSSRWPPLDPSVVNGVDRKLCRVRAPTSPFNIFVAACMDRLGPADWRMLWAILRDIPDGILHFYGLPMCCINGILEESRQIDENDRLGSQNLHEVLKQRGMELKSASIASRIKFMGLLPLPLHIDRLRKEMDAAVAPRFDGYDVYTHTSTCLTAGLSVLSVGGRGACGELELVGLACLVLGNDGNGNFVTQRIIKDLVTLRDNSSIGDVIRKHLDGHARAGTSFFDQSRFPEEIKALIQQLADGRAGVLNCATCEQEQQVISRASNGELVLAGSPEPPFDSQPPDSGEVWNEIFGPISGPIAICEGTDSSGKMDLVCPPLNSAVSRSHGRLSATLRRRHAPTKTDLAGSIKVACPRLQPMTLPLTIFHCRLPGPKSSLGRMTAPIIQLLPPSWTTLLPPGTQAQAMDIWSLTQR